MESVFLREAGRSLSFPLRVNTVVSLPHGRLPRVIERILPRLESFAEHGYALRDDTLAAMLKALLVLGQFERALALAELLQAKKDHQAELVYYHALALYRLSRIPEAIKLAQRSIELDAATGNAHLLLAVCQIKTDQGEAAGQTLRAALPVFSADESLLRFALPWIRRTADNQAILDVLGRIEVMAPTDADIAVLLADALYQAGREAEACLRYQRHQASLDRSRILRFGISLAGLGRTEEAQAILASLLTGGSAQTDLDLILQNLYDSGIQDLALIRLIASRMYGRGRIVDCLDFCQRAGPAGEKDYGLVFLMAECYTQRGGHDEAIRLLEGLSAGSSQEPERQYLLGYALVLAGRQAEAVPCLEAGLQSAGRQESVLRMLGEIASATGDHAQAAGVYRRLTRLRPDDAVLIAKAAWSAMRAGMVALAIEGFRSLVRLLPDCPEGWNNLGVLLAREGEYDEAARCFKTSLGIMPGQREAGKNLALVYDRVLRSRSAEYLERFADGELSAPGRADG
jgi:tetratricopeptide (TPR) repeat protein